MTASVGCNRLRLRMPSLSARLQLGAGERVQVFVCRFARQHLFITRVLLALIKIVTQHKMVGPDAAYIVSSASVPSCPVYHCVPCDRMFLVRRVKASRNRQRQRLQTLWDYKT